MIRRAESRLKMSRTRVYRIMPDERYQRLIIPAGPEAEEYMTFTADPLEIAGAPLTAEIVNPTARAGKLWYVEGGSIAVRPDRNKPSLVVNVPALGLQLTEPSPSSRYPGCEAIQTPLEMAGQLLPVMLDGKGMILLNVLECINCLDWQNSHWLDSPSPGPDARIVRYAFHSNRFVVSSIFKIPETCAREVLVVERTRNPEEEFKAAVEKSRMNGIAFELLWEESTV